MVSKADYPRDSVEAARSVLIELIHLLGAYRKDLVLIGGWVPELLLSTESTPHTGSMDVDLALNHVGIGEDAYQTIQELLLSRGYEQGKQPFIFFRKVPAAHGEISVQVDLLAGEYEGTGKKHRTQRVQGIMARKVRGCDLVFDKPVSVTVTGELPGGGKDSVSVPVAPITSFLVMKGMALDERLKEKDAWDIIYCVENYPEGLDALVEAFRADLEHSLVREGLEKIAKHFANESGVGPKFVADFENIGDPEDRAIRQREAYEKVSYLMEKLGIK